VFLIVFTVMSVAITAATGVASRFVDADGAAEHLHVTKRFVRRLVAEKRIPYHKLGKLVRFDLRDLDAYAEAGRVDSATRPKSTRANPPVRNRRQVRGR
jgi:excisionase family DNA binding protein